MLSVCVGGRGTIFMPISTESSGSHLRLYGVEHMVKDHSDSERKPAAATWATISD